MTSAGQFVSILPGRYTCNPATFTLKIDVAGLLMTDTAYGVQIRPEGIASARNRGVTMQSGPNLPGSTVILFLERNPDGTYGVISLAQGSFRVTTERDGSFWVERDPAAADLLVAGAADGKVDAVKVPLWSARAQVDAARGLSAPEADALPAGTVVHDLVEVKGGVR